MSEWKEYSIKRLIEQEKIAIGDGYRAKNEELSTEGLPFARAGNINNGFHFDGADCLPFSDQWKVGNKVSKPMDIVFTSKGTVGRFGFVTTNTPQFVYSPQLCFWRSLDQSIIDSRWLYFWMNGREFWEQVHGLKDQTDMADYVNLNDQRNMVITIPALPEQRAIAAVLSSLDDKIDLLHRQNKTLEALAETLFRQWFVEEADAGWEEGKVHDYCLHYKDSIKPQDFPEKCFSYYSIPAFDNNMNPVIGNGSEIQSGKYAVVPNCLLFSKLNPNKDKRIWLILDQLSENPVCSTEFQVVLPKNREHLFFIYSWLSNPLNYNEIASGVGGTSGSHQRIDPADIFNFPCPKIDDDFIESFNGKVEPIFLKMNKNRIQIRNLESLRDTLLPKLMSGEVRVAL